MTSGNEHTHGHSHETGANERFLFVALALTSTFLVRMNAFGSRRPRSGSK